jgi:hypothetical protein
MEAVPAELNPTSFPAAANLSVRNYLYCEHVIFGPQGHKMTRLSIVSAVTVSLALSSSISTPVQAGGGDVAAGIIGGLAAGTIVGAAVAGPHYYYPPPPPVYVAPPPNCYWTQGQPVWDGYRGAWTYPPIRVCE